MSLLQTVSRAIGGQAVKCSSPEAWATTARLRQEYIGTTLESLPARWAEASKEFGELRAKLVSRDITINELGVGAVRAVELYAYYLVGRVIGSRSMS